MPTTYDGILYDQGGGAINVKSSAWGATGNGTTDDRNALQNAINATPAGGVLLLAPAATSIPGATGSLRYKVSSSLNITKSITIIGYGAEIAYDGSGSAFVIAGGDAVEVKMFGLWITGVDNNAPNAIELQDDCKQFVLEDVVISEFGGKGIWAHSSTEYERQYFFRHVRVESCHDGIYFEGTTQTDDVTIQDCVLGYHEGFGLRLFNCYVVTVSGGNIEQNDSGNIWAKDVVALTIDGVHFENRATSASVADIVCIGSDASHGVRGLQIRGNYFNGNGGDGNHDYAIRLGDFGNSTAGTGLITGNFATNYDTAFIFNNGPQSRQTWVLGNFLAGSLAVTDDSTYLVTLASQVLTLDFPSIASSATAELNVTILGARVGRHLVVASPQGSPEAGLIWSAYVSANDTATVRIANVTTGSINPASRAWAIALITL